MPISMHLAITSPVRCASTRPPKLLQPRPTAETIRPELPRLRYSKSRVPFEAISYQLSVFSYQPRAGLCNESCRDGDDGTCLAPPQEIIQREGFQADTSPSQVFV